MEKAGFLAVNNYNAVDSNGTGCTIVTCMLCGTRFAVRVGELRQACVGIVSARVEPLRNRQGQVLLGSAGTISLSRSGKALNIELVNGDRFTVSVLPHIHSPPRRSSVYRTPCCASDLIRPSGRRINTMGAM